MRTLSILVVPLFALLVAVPASAQPRLSVEVDGGAAFATQDLGDADLGTGFGLAADVAYRVMPHLAVYGGWGWHHFATDQPLAGADLDVEETGYTFGLEFVHPLGRTRYGYFVRAGGLYDHLEFEDGDGDVTADTDHGFGWEAGAGFVVPVTPRVSLRPGLRYHALSRDVEIGDVTMDVDLTYLAVDVGVVWTF